MIKLLAGRCPGDTLVDGVVRLLTDAIESRQLPQGAKLASIRQCAIDLGVSKSTIVEAYDRLVANGLVRSRPKSGFYVQSRPDVLKIAAVDSLSRRDVDEFWLLRNSVQPSTHALRPGCGWLPTNYLNAEGIRRAMGVVRKEPDKALVDYGSPAGLPTLRGQLLKHLQSRAIDAQIAQVLLTDSGSQALDLAFRFLLKPGDTVFVDDPCYFNFLACLRAHRVRIVGIPLTPTGPDMHAFAHAAALHRPRLYVTNSVLQNPTGITFSSACAHRILTLAQQFDIAIVEDDTFADLQESPGPRLSSLDSLRRSLYIGSFSKTVSGTVRCGYIVAPTDWTESLLDLKLATSYGNNEVSARIIHQILTDGSYRKHVEAVRSKLRRIRPRVKKELADSGLTLWSDPEEGLFLWASSEGVDMTQLALKGIDENIVLAPGNVFSVSGTAQHFMRFNVAHTQHPNLFEFLRRSKS
ncbi:MAG: PLP-dependent aminotransferase family protein [Pseudomonadota bacterium]